MRAVDSLSFNLLDSLDCPGFLNLGSISGLWIKFGHENSTTWGSGVGKSRRVASSTR